HVVLLATFYYWYTVTNFGDYEVLVFDTWSLSAQVTVAGVLTFFVQLFFAFRVYRLSGKKVIIPSVICFFSILQLACAIAYTVVGYRIQKFSASEKATPYTTCSLAAELACDSTIAGSMIYYLLHSRSPFSKTNKAVNLLITYALNTCLLTNIFTIITLIAWLIWTKTLIYATFYFVLTRLYSCSFMSTLNSRDNVRQVLNSNDREWVSFPMVATSTSHTDDRDGSVRMPEATKWPDPSSALTAYSNNSQKPGALTGMDEGVSA
ncbi:uncharacterized protein LAESUDRAFT_732913, partial [Laetiporus sulphureus 93-53]